MSFADTANISILIATALANLMIGLSVLIGKPRDQVRQAFFVLTLGGFLLIAGLVSLSLTQDFQFDPVAHYGAVLLFLGVTWFVSIFPTPLRLPVRPALLYAPLLIAAIAIIPGHYIVSGIVLLPNGGFVPVLGPLLPVWSAILFSYTAFSVGILLYRYSTTSGKVQLQILYLLFGLGIFLLSLVIFGTVLPAAFGITSLNSLGPLASLVFVILAAYAIVRHQLMDIRLVIQRSLIYSLLIGVVIGFYVLFISGLSALFPANETASSFVGAIVTTVLGIFGAPHIERFFRRITDRVFFKDTYDYAEAMHSLSEVLYAHVEFEDLVRESEEALALILRSSSVRITLGENEALPERDRVLQVPIKLDGDDIGCIHLGKKRSGDPYSPQDIQLLKTFAYQAATALSRAQLYADAQEHASKLEAKVAERTRELSETHERERQMLNDLSHNLQTPLTILQTKLERLKPLIKEDEKVRTFEQALTDFSGFIYDLMALARLEGGRKPEYAEVDLSALVAELADEIHIIASGSDVAVSTEIAPGLKVLGDERRLRETFMNIASNALKYMKKDGLKKISFSAQEESDCVIVSVEDTGLGIPAEDLPHVFDRFYRAQGLPTEKQGTGLGLAIAKRIVEQHRGTITALSTDGKGTRIEVRIPRLMLA